MNKYIAVGRLTADSELRTIQTTGTLVLSFSLAVNSVYKDKQRTIFWKCNIFGNSANSFEQYLKKGVKILVVGEVVDNKYTNKAGVEVNTKELFVKNIEFLERREN